MVQKGQATGQGGLKVLLQELAMPAFSILEEHINPMTLAPAAALRAKPFAGGQGDGQGSPAKSADFALANLAHGGRALTSHEPIIGE